MIFAMYKYILFSLLMCILFACMPPKKEQSEVSTPPPPPPNPVIVKGELLFKQHCSSCHMIDRKLVGPALKGTRQKYADDLKWLYAYIRDNKKLIKAGDPKAVALYETYNKMEMNTFNFLTDEDIDAILRYADAYIADVPSNKIISCY